MSYCFVSRDNDGHFIPYRWRKYPEYGINLQTLCFIHFICAVATRAMAIGASNITAIGTSLNLPLISRVPFVLQDAFLNVLAIGTFTEDFMGIREVFICKAYYKLNYYRTTFLRSPDTMLNIKRTGSISVK